MTLPSFNVSNLGAMPSVSEVIVKYIRETLKALKAEGYRLFVATAKPTIYAKRILDHFELSQYFVQIYG
ncbi:HAD hydrolase-like protein, partial [Acinetobacter baumannii]|uniref:HAD hydrolase-like protein n=1 Tax=Acinetobacter baumannii TaxID=470 RepID=UPI00294B5BAF